VVARGRAVSAEAAGREVGRWVSRMPDAALFALLGTLAAVGIAGARVAWSFEHRITRIEGKIDAIADRVGVDDEETHAAR
jgi:hypothetical protein